MVNLNWHRPVISLPHELRGVLPVFQTPWLPDETLETLDLETLASGRSWDAVLIGFATLDVAAAACWLMLKTERSVIEQSRIKR